MDHTKPVWTMPFKSQEFNDGPQVAFDGRDLKLRLDYETPTGAYRWAALTFFRVHAFCFTNWRSCTVEQIQSYDRLVVVEDSELRRSLKRVPEDASHYRIYFDERGCYDIVAGEFGFADQD